MAQATVDIDVDQTHRSRPHRSGTVEVPQEQHHRTLLEVQHRRRAQLPQVPRVARVARLSKSSRSK